MSALPKGRWGRVLLRLALSAAILFVVSRFIDLDRAMEGFRRLRPGTWVAALGAFAVLHFASALKWRWFVGVAGARISPGVSVRCHAAGLFASLCLPSMIGGDVLRAGLAMQATPARTPVVVASVIDRVSDMTALLALALAALPLVSVGAETPLQSLPLAGGIVAAAGAAGILGLRWAVASRFVRKLPRKLARFVLEVAGALRTMARRPVASVGGWLASVAIQSGFLLVNVWLGGEMGLDMTVAQWFLLWPLAKIAAMLPLSFGGLGVREAAFAALVGPFGYDKSLAAAASLVWQSVLIVGGLIAGAYWMASSRRGETRPANA